LFKTLFIGAGGCREVDPPSEKQGESDRHGNQHEEPRQ